MDHKAEIVKVNEIYILFIDGWLAKTHLSKEELRKWGIEI